MTEPQPLKTNHNIRIVNLTTGASILCVFGEVREEDNVVGYRMVYPYTLSLGDPNEDGTVPIQYTRFCVFSPVEEHRISGEHIISVVFPENSIVDNFVKRLEEIGISKEQIFFEEATDGDNSEPAEAAE